MRALNDDSRQRVVQAARWLDRAVRVACLTGAGVSAESGVATFRGPDGLWEGRRPEDVATPQAFARDPGLVCAFYHARRLKLMDCRPNPAHFALAEMERRFDAFHLMTQNVDNLHALAGSRRVIELHGNIWIDRCSRCGEEVRLERPGEDPMSSCTKCGGLMRVGVVWFGETLPPGVLEAAAKAAADCEVVLVVGTSSVVQPAASLAWHAKGHGARVVEINPESTPLTSTADLVVAEKAGVALPAIISALGSSLHDSGPCARELGGLP